MTTPSSNPLKCVDLSGVDIWAECPVETSSYRLAVELMARKVNGYQYRLRRVPLGDWITICWVGSGPFAWDTYTFRINPASRPKVMVPWSGPDDVPGSVCWIRAKHHPHQYMIISLQPNGAVISSQGNFPASVHWNGLAMGWEHSVDRKVWLPCTREETK